MKSENFKREPEGKAGQRRLLDGDPWPLAEQTTHKKDRDNSNHETNTRNELETKIVVYFPNQQAANIMNAQAQTYGEQE